MEGETLLWSYVEMVVIAARSSDLGKVEESNGRKNRIMRLLSNTSYRNAKIQEQEKIKNNCERKIER